MSARNKHGAKAGRRIYREVHADLVAQEREAHEAALLLRGLFVLAGHPVPPLAPNRAARRRGRVAA